MKIRVRLYHYHDLDLVSLYREGRISISKAVKIALNSFAQKKYFIMETKEKKEEKVAKPVYMFNITLNEQKDRAAIELLNKVEKGYRNNFLKQLLRMYLRYEIPACYISPEDTGYFNEREKGLSGERKIVPAPAGRNIRSGPPAAVPVITDSPAVSDSGPVKIEAGPLIIRDLSSEELKEESSSVKPSGEEENSEAEQIKEGSFNAGGYKSMESGNRAEDERTVETAELEAAEDEESEAELIGMFKNMIM